MSHPQQWSDVVKRAVDLVGATIGLVLGAPLIAASALAIVVESGRPVLFRQERVGKDGRLFTVFKLRTMVEDPDRSVQALDREDPGITRVGKVLRASSLDELPQLINVFRGEMSLVGPRPTIADQVAEYDDFQRRRLEVKPGLTGWAQVNGRNSLSWSERIALDVWYVDHRCLPLDLKIIARTPLACANIDATWGGQTDDSSATVLSDRGSV